MDGALFTVADAMTPITVSAATRDPVAIAAKIISQHSLAALPVVDEDRVVGLVTPLQLLLAPPYRLVAEVMTTELTPATPALPVPQAYALMTRQHVEVLPVVDDGKIVGQISATAILRTQGQQNDLLTGLPTASVFRAWAAAALERGHEITILFVDLDNFGEVNKALGHVVGDDMLCAVAQLLGGLVDASTDLLCRYGGDEFAIATTRHEADTRGLMQRIQDVVALPVDMGGATRRISTSIGIAGGRRVEGRKRAHIAATVEDLLTLASRASTVAKEAKRADRIGPTAARPGEGRLRLVDVTVQTDERGGAVTVALKLGSREGAGRAAALVHGRGISFLAAEATLDAIRQTAGETHTYVLEELTEVPTAVETLAVVVLATSSNGPRQFVGSARAPTLPQAVTKAILNALNRPLARTLAEPL